MADCFERMSKAFPELDKESLERIVQKVEEIKGRTGMSLSDKQERLKKLQREEKAFAALRLKNEINDQIKVNDRINDIMTNPRFKDREEGLLSLFEAVEPSDIPLEAVVKFNQDDLMTHLNIGLRERHLLDAAKSGEFDKDVYQVMFSGIENTGENADIVNGLASIYKAMNERQRRMLNRSGASILRRNDYIHRQFHNGERISATPFEEWAAELIGRVDVDKTFGHLRNKDGVIPREDLVKALKEDYTKFKANYNSIMGFDVREDLDKMFSMNNTVARQNKSRSYHFKSGEDFYEYNKRFGMEGNLLHTLSTNYRRSARTSAMIERFGTSPKNNLKKIINTTLQGMDEVEAAAISNKVYKAFDVATGRGDYGVDNTKARVGQAIRVHQLLTKLGRSAFSAGMDIVPTIMHSKTATGENIIKTSFRSVNDFMRSIPKGSREKVGEELLLSSEAFLNELKEATLGSGYTPGSMSRVVDNFFSLSGLNWITEVSRKANARMALTDLKTIVSAPKRNVEMNNTIARYKFTEEEISLLRDMDEITPLAIQRVHPNRNELAQKVHAMINQRVHRGSPMPDARTRRRLMLYNPAGTTEGEAARFFAQFKSSIMKITQDTNFMLRASSPNGDMRNFKTAKNLAQFLMLSIAVGGLRNMIVDGGISQKDDFDIEEYLNKPENYVNALATGGGLGIYGDAISSMFKGGSLYSTMSQFGIFVAGPAPTNIIKGKIELLSLPEDGADESTAKYIIEQIPGQNLWFLLNLNRTFAEELANEF